MNNDVKISLTINIEGSTRHYLGKKKVPFKVTKQDLTSKKLPSNVRNKVVFSGIRKISEYEYLPAQVHINMTRAAYDYMKSDEKPEKYYKNDWRKLSADKRIAWHMAFTASTYGSTDFSYTILED